MDKIILLLSVSLLFGCTSNISPNSYSVGTVGQVTRTISAVIISARPVDVSGTSSLGSEAGTMTGAIVGSNAGSNDRLSIVGTIGGALVGHAIGMAIEKNSTQQKGMEYVIETQNGNLMTIVQGIETIFNVGQKVFVLYGERSRIINDPRGEK